MNSANSQCELFDTYRVSPMTTETVPTKKPRWASDIGCGMLVAGIGSFIVAIGAFFTFWPVSQIGFGVLAVGAGMGLIGGFNYFMRKRDQL